MVSEGTAQIHEPRLGQARTQRHANARTPAHANTTAMQEQRRGMGEIMALTYRHEAMGPGIEPNLVSIGPRMSTG